MPGIISVALLLPFILVAIALGQGVFALFGIDLPSILAPLGGILEAFSYFMDGDWIEGLLMKILAPLM